MAIRAYQAQTELTQIVLNFYRNKENGIPNTVAEPEILKIKGELAIDDEYLQGKINAGLQKINQGDKQGACADFNFVKYMGSDKANDLLAKHCN